MRHAVVSLRRRLRRVLVTRINWREIGQFLLLGILYYLFDRYVLSRLMPMDCLRLADPGLAGRWLSRGCGS